MSRDDCERSRKVHRKVSYKSPYDHFQVVLLQFFIWIGAVREAPEFVHDCSSNVFFLFRYEVWETDLHPLSAPEVVGVVLPRSVPARFLHERAELRLVLWSEHAHLLYVRVAVGAVLRVGRAVEVPRGDVRPVQGAVELGELPVQRELNAVHVR